MAKRIGIFVDVSNLYFSIRIKFNKQKLDYRKYLNFIKDLGNIQQAIAYGSQVSNEAEKFINRIQQIGFQTKYKRPKEYKFEDKTILKADWNVGMAIDIFNMYERFDTIILGSADGNMTSLVNWLKTKGIDVIILACIISKELAKASLKAIEIPESLLEEK